MVARMTDEVDAATEGNAAFATSQALHGKVQRGQRRRTSCVERDGWSAPSEKVRQTTAGGAWRCTGGHVGFEAGEFDCFERQRPIVGAHSNVDATIAVP